MNTYIKNNTKTIRIEPNPFRDMRNKFKMKTHRLSGGKPIVNQDGKPVFTEVTPESLYRTPGTHRRISPSRTANGVNTGLNKLIDNPYKDNTSFTPEWEPVLKNKEKALLQHILEYECGFDIDFLTHRIPSGAVASDEPNKKFFQTVESKPKLDGGVTFLKLSNPIHRVNYYTCLAHKAIANTWDDLLDGGNDEAEWFIVDEADKQQREKSRTMKTVEGGAALAALNDSESDALIKMTKVLELSEASDRNLSKDKAFNLIFNYWNKDNASFENFIAMYDLWKDPVSGRSKFIALAELYDYQHQGIVSYKNGRYTWYKTQPGEPAVPFVFKGKMAFVTEFLLDPAMQDNVEILQEEYDKKIR